MYKLKKRLLCTKRNFLRSFRSRQSEPICNGWSVQYCNFLWDPWRWPGKTRITWDFHIYYSPGPVTNSLFMPNLLFIWPNLFKTWSFKLTVHAEFTVHSADLSVKSGCIHRLGISLFIFQLNKFRTVFIEFGRFFQKPTESQGPIF
jgi:hypothetical protein